LRLFSRAALIALVAAVGLGAAYFGLMEHVPLALPARPPAPLPPALDAALRCDRAAPPEIALDRDGETGRIRYRRPGRPAREDALRFVRADGARARAPAVIVTPILAGDYTIEKIILDDLSRHGMHAVLVDRRVPAEASLEDLEEALGDMVAARRAVLDWLETRDDVDPARLGAYGVSLGGIVTSMLASVEPKRLRAAIVIMAGGDMASVLAGSVEPEARELRARCGAGEGASAEALAAFEARARATLRTCPLALAPFADPREILFVTTRRDTSVPTPCQARLREALGRPETISLPTGHYGAVIYMKTLAKKAREFLKKKFAEPRTG
jgi:dienelactone hydrolase